MWRARHRQRSRRDSVLVFVAQRRLDHCAFDSWLALRYLLAHQILGQRQAELVITLDRRDEQKIVL